MYGVTNGYKQAMLSPAQERDVKGYIGAQAFIAEDLIARAFSISNQCMESMNIAYGSVYVGELDMTVRPDFPIGRRNYRGLVIRPEVGLKVSGAYEYVPCGVFTIVKANWRSDGIEIVAYDNMIYFDRAFPGREECDNLTPYGFLAAACTACGVQLANTRAEIEDMPNGEEVFGIYEENSIETWRDLISYVAQVLAGFATIDRTGKLVIKQFGNDTGMTLDATNRFTGASLSDYITHYTGIGCVLTAQNEYYYRGAAVDDGETMKIGENPLLQHFLAAELNRWLDAMLGELENFAFTPFKAKQAIDVAYDLGDVIHYTGGLAATGGDDVCIMAFTYIYNISYTAEGYGDDPYYADVQSKIAKNLDGLRGTTRTVQQDVEELKQSAIIFLLPQSTSDDPIGDGENSQIASWWFESAEGAEVALSLTIGFEIETTVSGSDYGDATLTAVLKVNGVTEETLTETYGDGEHILTISHILDVLQAGIYNLTIEVTMLGGDLT